MNARTIWKEALAVVLIGAVGLGSAGADNLIFYPTDDTFVDEWVPNHAWGSSSRMMIRNTGNGPWEADPLVRFDISSIPPGTNIPSATLYLYYYRWQDSNPAGRPLTCYRITSNWNEGTTTWNTQPTRASTVTSSATVPSSFQWMHWDVTDDVENFVNGSVNDYGWMIMDETYWGGGSIPLMGFYSKEAPQLIPYLEVVPEPGTLGLLLLGSLVILSRQR